MQFGAFWSTEGLGLGGHKSTDVTEIMVSITADMNVIFCVGRYLQSYGKEKDNKREHIIFFVDVYR